MQGRYTSPVTDLTLEMRPSSDGESYLFGVDVHGAFIVLSESKSGTVDGAVDLAAEKQKAGQQGTVLGGQTTPPPDSAEGIALRQAQADESARAAAAAEQTPPETPPQTTQEPQV